MTHIICVDIECLLVKHDTCANNTDKSYTKTISTRVLSGYTMSVNNEFKANYHTYYRGKDCMEKLSKELIKIGYEIANEEDQEEIFLTKDETLKHEECEKCHICDRPFNTNKESKYYHNFTKVRDHCHYTGKYRGAAHSLCNLRYPEQRDTPIAVQNGSKYDFHLLIKDLAKESKSNIRYISENIQTYKTFSLPIKVETDEDDEGNMETKKYNLRFIDSCRFMNMLDKLVDNLSEININACLSCKKRNKTTQYCKFIKLDKKRLMYKCLECNDTNQTNHYNHLLIGFLILKG